MVLLSRIKKTIRKNNFEQKKKKHISLPWPLAAFYTYCIINK